MLMDVWRKIKTGRAGGSEGRLGEKGMDGGRSGGIVQFLPQSPLLCPQRDGERAIEQEMRKDTAPAEII